MIDMFLLGVAAGGLIVCGAVTGLAYWASVSRDKRREAQLAARARDMRGVWGP